MDCYGALSAPALAMIVEPRMDTNGPGYQTDGSSERLTPTSQEIWTLVGRPLADAPSACKQAAYDGKSKNQTARVLGAEASAAKNEPLILPHHVPLMPIVQSDA